MAKEKEQAKQAPGIIEGMSRAEVRKMIDDFIKQNPNATAGIIQYDEYREKPFWSVITVKA